MMAVREAKNLLKRVKLVTAFVPLTDDGGDVLKISKSEVRAMLEAMCDEDEIRAALIGDELRLN